MSIIFQPNPDTLAKYRPIEVKKTRVIERKKFTETEIDLIVNLRAVGCSFQSIGDYLGRPQPSCSHIVFSRKLYDRIENKKQALIKKVL